MTNGEWHEHPLYLFSHVSLDRPSIGLLYGQKVPVGVISVDIGGSNSGKPTIIWRTDTGGIHSMVVPDEGIIPVVVAMRLSC